MKLEVSPGDESPRTFLTLNFVKMFLVRLESVFDSLGAQFPKNEQTLITAPFLHLSLEVGHFYSFDAHCSGVEMLLDEMQLCYAF